MRPDVAAGFDRMAAAAHGEAGLSLLVTSGYRSDAEQARLCAAHPDPKWVAPPGTSLDRYATELGLGPPAAYAWLAANARPFGFIHRYAWEPWHLPDTVSPVIRGARRTTWLTASARNHREDLLRRHRGEPSGASRLDGERLHRCARIGPARPGVVPGRRKAPVAGHLGDHQEVVAIAGQLAQAKLGHPVDAMASFILDKKPDGASPTCGWSNASEGRCLLLKSRCGLTR